MRDAISAGFGILVMQVVLYVQAPFVLWGDLAFYQIVLHLFKIPLHGIAPACAGAGCHPDYGPAN
jgi:hypothetical protein